MKYWNKERQLGNTIIGLSCSGNWAEMSFGITSHLQLSRSTVSDDLKRRGVFLLASASLLWWRLSISTLCFTKPETELQ